MAAKILFITLSNVGDVILSLPALDRLINAYPKAEITVICGERAAGIFEESFFVKRVIAYNKHKSILNMIKLPLQLRKNNYDLVVDLKNSALPLFLSARHKTYPWHNAPIEISHMRDRNLYKVLGFIPLATKGQCENRKMFLSGFSKGVPDSSAFKLRKNIYISGYDRSRIANLLNMSAVSNSDRLAVISPGARSHIKRWPEDKFAGLSDMLIKGLKLKVVIVGDENDQAVCQKVVRKMSCLAIDLSGKTNIKSLAALLERSDLVISNDSATMHLSSYLDRPTLGIFGPTDADKYGPWSIKSEIVRSNLSCAPCEAAQCKTGAIECLSDIKVEDVYAAAKKLL